MSDKYCVDCKYYEPSGKYDAMCSHKDNVEIDLVKGVEVPIRTLKTLRLWNHYCGIDGIWFEPKNKPQATTTETLNNCDYGFGIDRNWFKSKETSYQVHQGDTLEIDGNIFKVTHEVTLSDVISTLRRVIKQENKAIRRKNKLIKRLRNEVDDLKFTL